MPLRESEFGGPGGPENFGSLFRGSRRMRGSWGRLGIRALGCSVDLESRFFAWDRALVSTSESFSARRASRFSIVEHNDSSDILEMKNLS